MNKKAWYTFRIVLGLSLIHIYYVIYSEYQQDGRFMVKLFCVNPAVNLQAVSYTHLNAL